MKVKIILFDETIERHLQKIEKMLLLRKIHLKNISFNQRINHPSFYVLSFRATRNCNSCTEYVEVLKILEFDIKLCKDSIRQLRLKSILDSYVSLSPYNGELLFDEYKKHYKQYVL